MDFGMYTGLQRKSNIFETKAANRQMEMQIAATREQRAQADLQKDTEVDVAMQQYFNSINELDVLDQDKERIKAEEMTLRMDVIDKVRQYNGNLQNFAFGGGAATMEKYKNNVMESESVQNAIANKTNYAQWQHAQANGLFVKDVSVEVPFYNEETGQTEMRKQVVGMDKAYQMFEKGQIGKIPYDGAEKDIDIGPEFFQKIFKDTANPYSTDNKVTANDVYLTVREDGGSHDQATTKMKKYQELIDNGATQWTYRMLDPMDLKLKQAQLNNTRLRNKALRTSQEPKQGKRVTDMVGRFDDLERPDTKIGKAGGTTRLLETEMDILFNNANLGFTKDDVTGMYKALKSVEAFDWYDANSNPDPKKYDMTMFETIMPDVVTIDERTGKPMLKMDVTYSASTASGNEEAYPMYEQWDGNEEINDNSYIGNFSIDDQWGSDEKFSGSVYVPLDAYLNKYNKTIMNEKTNVLDDHYNQSEASKVTGQEEATYQYFQILEQGARQIAIDQGISYDQAMSQLTGGAGGIMNEGSGIPENYSQQAEHETDAAYDRFWNQ